MIEAISNEDKIDRNILKKLLDESVKLMKIFSTIKINSQSNE